MKRWSKRLWLPFLLSSLVACGLWFWLPPSPRAVLPRLESEDYECRFIRFSPDSQCVATAYYPVFNDEGDYALHFWHVFGERQTTLRSLHPIRSVAFSPEGKSVAGETPREHHLFSADGRLCAVRETYEYESAFEQFRCLVRSPDPRDGVCVYPHVLLVDVASGALLARFDRAYFAEFSPDATLVAVAHDDGSVALYDLPLRSPWFKILGFAVATFVGAYALLTAAKRFWHRRGLAGKAVS
jgi:hypothetical protein